MACNSCKDVVEIEDLDVPHVVRKCANCGREMRVHSPGDHGIGIKVNKGDKFVIPRTWFKIYANPLKGKVHLTKAGLIWFAKLLFLEDLPKKRKDIEVELDKNEKTCSQILKTSELLKDLDIENPDHSTQIFETLKESHESAEWWAFSFRMFNDLIKDAIRENDAKKAAWAMACAERCRSLLIFKTNLEDVVRMGYSAKRIIDILKIWDGNKENADEEFWQMHFNENSYVLSQIFSVPIVFIQDKAYVGGMGIDRKGAKFVDYLYSIDTTNEAILIEIKTPTTKLLGAKYRNIFKPSAELSGTVIQISDYKTALMQNITAIAQDFGKPLAAFNPRCLIIAGNTEKQLDTDNKRRSFELFRANLNRIEIVTYDELFKKIEVLATLFDLIRKKN